MKHKLTNLLASAFTASPKIKNLILKRLGVEIEKSAYIDEGQFLRFMKNIKIDKGVSIGTDCTIIAFDKVEIGAYTQIANNLIMTSGTHDVNTRKPITTNGIVIGKYCWIGAGVVIAGSAKIGDGCVIAAGSVVVKSIPPWTLAAGVPATSKRSLPSPNFIHTKDGEIPTQLTDEM